MNRTRYYEEDLIDYLDCDYNNDAWLSNDEEQDMYNQDYAPPPRILMLMDILPTIEKKKPKEKRRKKSKGASAIVKKGRPRKLSNPLDHIEFKSPKIVRSKSFGPGIVNKDNTMKLKRRNSLPPPTASLSTMATTTITVTPQIHCLQSLLGRSNALGLHDSIVILSTETRAAIIITYSINDLTSVYIKPVINCSDEAATAMQEQMNQRLRLSTKYAPVQPLSKWSRYFNTCQEIANRKIEWMDLLTSLCSCDDQNRSLYNTFSRVLRQSKSITLGDCLAPFDLLERYLDKPVSEDAISSEKDERTTSPPAADRACLVCFDTIPSNDSSSVVVPCGHSTCSDCIRNYFRVAVKSGQGHIQCCAEKCDTRIGFQDAAHLLDNEELKRLVGFETSNTFSALGRFCPTPRCTGRHLQPVTTPTETPLAAGVGAHLLLCECGASQCADCRQPSHPGMSCHAASNFQKDIEAWDGEMKSIEWVMQNSRPCPKCRFPINRSEGCNHMRCQKCNFYFCYHCGGEGQRCLAYQCRNKPYWKEDPIYSGKALSRKMERRKTYRQTSDKLKRLINKNLTRSSGHTNSDGEDMLVEIQLTQVYLWVLANVLTADSLVFEKQCQRMEVVILALSLHQGAYYKSTRGSQPDSETSRVATFSTNRTVDDQLTGYRETFENILVDQELNDLLRMNWHSYLTEAKVAMRESIKTAFNSHARRKKARTKKKQAAHCNNLERLNVKLKRTKAPWKNGFSSSSSDGSSWSDDEDSSNKRSSRWKKTKSQVAARRSVALLNNSAL